MKSSQVEEFPVSPELDVNTSVAITEGIEQHHSKHDREQCRGKNTALLHPIAHLEGIRGVTILFHSSLHAIMERGNQCYDLVWTSELLQNLPQSDTVYGILGLGEVHKYEMELLILFAAFLLHLTDSKDHVAGAPPCAKTTL